MSPFPQSIHFMSSLGSSPLNFPGQPWNIIFHEDGRSFYALFGNEFRRYDFYNQQLISSFIFREMQESVRVFKPINENEVFIGHGKNDHIHQYTRRMICFNDELIKYNIRENKVVQRWEFPSLHSESGTKTVDISPDGKILILSHYSNTGNQTILAWDLVKNKEIRYLPGKANVKFLSSHEIVSSDHRVQKIFFSGITDNSELSFSFKGSYVHSLALSREENLLAVSTDTHLQIFNRKGEVLHETAGEFQYIGFDASDDKIISIVYPSGLIRLLEIPSLNVTNTIENDSGYELKYAPSVSGPLNAVAYGDAKGYHLIDLASGKDILAAQGHTKDVVSVQFSPSGKFAISLSSDGYLILWENEKEILHSKIDYGRVLMSKVNDSYFYIRKDFLSEMRVPEGEFLSLKGRVSADFYLDEKSGKIVDYWEELQSDENGWSSRNVGMLGASDKDNDTYLWKTECPQILREGSALAFSSDSENIYLVTDSRKLEVYDAWTGCLHKKYEHSDIYWPQFVRGKDILISRSWQHIEKWDLKQPDQKPKGLRLDDEIFCLTASADGTFILAATSTDIYLIDLAEMKVIKKFMLEPAGEVSSIGISPLNNYFLLGTTNGIIHRYSLE